MSVAVKDLIVSSEQSEIVQAVEALLLQHLPLDRLRKSGESTTADSAKWRELTDMGVFGIGLPVEVGGIGLTVVEEALVSLLLGRYLVSPSVLATSLAARMALTLEQTDLAAAMITGKVQCAFGIRKEGGVRVLDGSAASHVIIVEPDGAQIFARSELRDIISRASYDESMAIEDASTSEIPFLSIEGNALYLHAGLLVSSYLAGIAHQTTALAVEHAKNRVQFGKPIGSTQAIKHHCANMATQVNAASSLSLFAALTSKDEASDASFQVSAARLICGGAAGYCAALSVQIHGAMGFTAECMAHFFVKRARMVDRLAGARQQNIDALLATVSPFST